MINLSLFVERLNEYIDDKNLTVSGLAKEIKFSRATVSGLLNKAHTPSAKILIALTEYFNCPADYLLGLTDFPADKNFGCVKPFGPILSTCLKNAKITETQLQKDLKISSSLTYRWLSSKAMPGVNSLYELAKYFGCSVDYLLGREN